MVKTLRATIEVLFYGLFCKVRPISLETFEKMVINIFPPNLNGWVCRPSFNSDGFIAKKKCEEFSILVNYFSENHRWKIKIFCKHESARCFTKYNLSIKRRVNKLIEAQYDADALSADWS